VRYHTFLLQTPGVSIWQNPGMASPEPPHRAIVAAVDDDRRILESLEILLESADYEVRLFPCAQALLESDGLPEIDVLISDVGMPAMNGFELARVIHAWRPGLPVMLLTGRPDVLSGAPVELRCCHLFKKPFDGQELLTAVSEVLRSPHRGVADS
jgi:FixJ family two-component response regulator